MNSKLKSSPQKSSSKPRVSIGILVYKGSKYFDGLFESVFSSDYQDFEILVLDNNSPENDASIIRKKFGKKVKVFRSQKNLGFAGGHNFLIKKSKGDFYLCLNQDVCLEKKFISSLIKSINKDEKIAAVSGKILQWKTSAEADLSQLPKCSFGSSTIDTVGIRAFSNHSFEDIGQGEVDRGQFEKEKEVFACSAAAVLLRRSALEDISFKNEKGKKEYFDELFFMYKEDIDLGYRLRWSGWKSFYVPQATAFHDRSVSRIKKGIVSMIKNRGHKSLSQRKMSFLHHKILLEKNFSSCFSFRVRFFTWWRNLLTEIWVFLFERKIRPKKSSWSYLKKQIYFRKKQIKKRVSAREIERFFATPLKEL